MFSKQFKEAVTQFGWALSEESGQPHPDEYWVWFQQQPDREQIVEQFCEELLHDLKGVWEKHASEKTRMDSLDLVSGDEFYFLDASTRKPVNPRARCVQPSDQTKFPGLFAFRVVETLRNMPVMFAPNQIVSVVR